MKRVGSASYSKKEMMRLTLEQLRDAEQPECSRQRENAGEDPLPGREQSGSPPQLDSALASSSSGGPSASHVVRRRSGEATFEEDVEHGGAKGARTEDGGDLARRKVEAKASYRGKGKRERDICESSPRKTRPSSR